VLAEQRTLSERIVIVGGLIALVASDAVDANPESKSVDPFVVTEVEVRPGCAPAAPPLYSAL
jgi:hypothetical protein